MNAFSEPTEKGENPKERLGRLKPDLSLIPQSALVLEALAMMEGARKYGPYNWRETPVKARTYIAASMRHLAAWLDGEELAQDSLIHHLAHARASLGVVMDAQVCGMMVDDRVKGKAGQVIEDHTICTPKKDWRDEHAVFDDSRSGLREAFDVRLLPKQSVVPSRIPEGREIVLFGVSPKAPVLKDPEAPTFYVSGPMRGIPDFNFPAFDAARDLGHRLGYIIISPADMDRAVGIHENTDLAEAKVDVHSFVKRDVAVLLSLDPKKGDGIALLEGWERSTGAMAELFIARWLGLRIVSALTFRGYQRGSPADVIARVAESIHYDLDEGER